jgi:uncharacterized protein involved in exopolysaccharide biosynthesis
MTSQGVWNNVPHDPPPRRSAGQGGSASGNYSADWAARPRYAPTDFITLLWRERWLMLIVFLVILIAGGGAAFLMKKTYSAHASVLVRLGQEYVYEPRAGDAARGAVPTNDQVIQSETEILSSSELRMRAIQSVGLGRVYPALAAKYAGASPEAKRKILEEASEAMFKDLTIQTAPDTAVIRLSYDNPDPDVAARVLNALLEQYLIYRRSVLLDGTSSALSKEQAIFESRLAEADAAYQAFLDNNGIGDFTAQKAALSTLQGQVETQKYATDAQLQDRMSRLAALDAQLAGISPEIGLYRDVSTAASDKLAQLRLDRESLLSRYKPDAQPVKDIDAQIAQLTQGVSSGRTLTDGAKRYGVNPVFQTLQTEKIQLTAEVAALKQTQAVLGDQIQQINQRLLKMSALEPQFTALSRDRDVLQANVKDFQQKAEQDQAARQIAGSTNDNIRIVERAQAPTKGTSLKKPVFILAFLFAGFTALCAGLLRMFLRPGLPTPASASRTLGLPVLATAGVKGR